MILIAPPLAAASTLDYALAQSSPKHVMEDVDMATLNPTTSPL